MLPQTFYLHPSQEDQAAWEALQQIDVSGATDGKSLMGIEGNASKLFFATYFRQLGWVRREPRCKHDITNLLLDIGYTYLFQFLEALLNLYGFDLYCGVLHTLFYQRKSLVCDIIEPFRCIIDNRVRKAHNLKQINEKDFFQVNGMWNLSYKNQSKYTKLFISDILSHKEEMFKFVQAYYRWFMKDASIDTFPQFKI